MSPFTGVAGRWAVVPAGNLIASVFEPRSNDVPGDVVPMPTIGTIVLKLIFQKFFNLLEVITF